MKWAEVSEICTADGSNTLISGVLGETYHSTRGAVGEARHVFIEGGFRHAEPSYAELSFRASEATRVLRVLEMGLGSGLNAWLTLLEAERAGVSVEYVGVEKYPVPPDVATKLDYTDDPRFAALHTAPWDAWMQISPSFRLLKRHADLTEAQADAFSEGPKSIGLSDEKFDVVYWDAFSPDVQPELWTAELFGRVYETMAPGGVLVTYSAKGDVRRALLEAGFAVEKLPGALGKRHMLRAKKDKK